MAAGHFPYTFTSYFPGVYAPLTKYGNIVVDGFLASCYADTDPDLAHTVMKPLQWFPSLMEIKCGDDQKFPVFVTMAKQLENWVSPFGKLHNYFKY